MRPAESSRAAPTWNSEYGAKAFARAARAAVWSGSLMQLPATDSARVVGRAILPAAGFQPARWDSVDARIGYSEPPKGYSYYSSRRGRSAFRNRTRVSRTMMPVSRTSSWLILDSGMTPAAMFVTHEMASAFMPM